MSNDVKEKIFKQIVKSKLESDLHEVGRKLSSIMENLSFLYPSNEILLTLIVDHFIQNFDKDTNIFTFDFESLSQNTPQETKDKLFESVITQFSKQVELNSLNPNPQKGLDLNVTEEVEKDSFEDVEETHYSPSNSSNDINTLKDQLPI